MFEYDRRTSNVFECESVGIWTGDANKMKTVRFGLWNAADSIAQDWLWNKEFGEQQENNMNKLVNLPCR